MRTSSILTVASLIGMALGLGPTLPFDGTPSPNSPVAAVEGVKGVADALKAGDGVQDVTALQYAADHGQGFALWQLGRMFAEGDGVKRDDYRAFEYFQKFADSHADDNPAMPRSRFVANAFVSLGRYYLDGIPNSSVSANPELARRMFAHAASYFGDPEAQYQLAMLYIKDRGASDVRRAIPWLVLAANKGHFRSQAMLGRILFKGEHGIRQPASGLMWLTIACDGPGAKVPWIAEMRENALKQATDKERASALVLLERWVQGRHE
jgi:TPR repeat protein